MTITVVEQSSTPSTPATGYSIIYPKSDGRWYFKDDAGVEHRLNDITNGTATASTSGTSIDFTGIPAWVKRITFHLVGVSTNGSAATVLQIGDSGGIETTGYLGSAVNLSDSSAITGANGTGAFLITGGIQAAASVLHGRAVLDLVDSSANTWVFNSLIGGSNAAYCSIGGGSKSLSGTLTQVRLTTGNGTDTFDAGTVNISYEG